MMLEEKYGDRLLTPDDAAEIFQVHPRTWCGWIRTGKIAPHNVIKLGGGAGKNPHYRHTARQIVAIIDDFTIPPTKPIKGIPHQRRNRQADNGEAA